MTATIAGFERQSRRWLLNRQETAPDTRDEVGQKLRRYRNGEALFERKIQSRIHCAEARRAAGPVRRLAAIQFASALEREAVVRQHGQHRHAAPFLRRNPPGNCDERSVRISCADKIHDIAAGIAQQHRDGIADGRERPGHVRTEIEFRERTGRFAVVSEREDSTGQADGPVWNRHRSHRHGPRGTIVNRHLPAGQIDRQTGDVNELDTISQTDIDLADDHARSRPAAGQAGHRDVAVEIFHRVVEVVLRRHGDRESLSGELRRRKARPLEMMHLTDAARGKAPDRASRRRRAAPRDHLPMIGRAQRQP